MVGITVAVEATAGSAIGREDPWPGPLPGSADGPPVGGGWPVGRGCVPDTLGEGARPVEALVLMRDPAVPGAAVPARPVAVLHLAAQGNPEDEVLCVAGDPCFADLADTRDLPRWHAGPDAWAAVLARLSPQPAYEVTGCGSREEAEQLVADARHTYERLTGSLE